MKYTLIAKNNKGEVKKVVAETMESLEEQLHKVESFDIDDEEYIEEENWKEKGTYPSDHFNQDPVKQE